MAEAYSHTDSTSSHEDAPEANDGPDSQAISSTNAHDVAAALRGSANSLEDSHELIHMEDIPLVDYETPRGEAQPQGSPESTDRWTALVGLPKLTRHFACHIVNHWTKYTCLSIVIIAVFLCYPAAILYRHLAQVHWDATLPTEQPNAAFVVPWRDRKHDSGHPRILVWDNTELGHWWTRDSAVCATDDEHSVKCDVTEDAHHLLTSDAVVFLAEQLEALGLPQLRTAAQFWVFWARTRLPSHGDTVNENERLPFAAHLFNWTMAHRDDADIALAYNTWRCVSDSSTKKPTYTMSREMKKDVAWVAGSCELRRLSDGIRARREKKDLTRNSLGGKVVMQLFQNCGEDQCSSPHKCIPHIANNYHFVLVSLKPDCFQSPYELIYNAFQYDVVPVVLAPPNTTLNVPAHSVVSTSDLQDVEELAARLRDLLHDRGLYENYFAWKQNCSWSPSEDELCPLCRALWKTPAYYRHCHPDVQEWWSNGSQCKDVSLYGLDNGFTIKP
ncbi:uncharacterized protein LOC119389133 [Rhipicephalus sanguineus]|uniref:Fucosyltransferase n=1 Tax=Rhipicephalus sanguineus TaxID=34632 RepID=A0A9D4PXW5_RHISA|nr:uncharacterized protein LOC119389133 [Rhipicephalus sanguineus]KAH7957855.1 hypothetical protein HPB52_023255 [Rhipicephalus sanguineus]